MNAAVIWFLVGLVILLMELALPGLILFFFGIGAWIVSIFLLIDPNISFLWQMIIFLVLSVSSLVLLRKYFTKLFKGKVRLNENKSELDDEIIGKRAKVVQRIASQKIGRVEFKGTNWLAESDEVLEKDDDVIIESKINLTLKVKKII